MDQAPKLPVVPPKGTDANISDQTNRSGRQSTRADDLQPWRHELLQLRIEGLLVVLRSNGQHAYLPSKLRQMHSKETTAVHRRKITWWEMGSDDSNLFHLSCIQIAISI